MVLDISEISNMNSVAADSGSEAEAYASPSTTRGPSHSSQYQSDDWRFFRSLHYQCINSAKTAQSFGTNTTRRGSTSRKQRIKSGSPSEVKLFIFATANCNLQDLLQFQLEKRISSEASHIFLQAPTQHMYQMYTAMHQNGSRSYEIG